MIGPLTVHGVLVIGQQLRQGPEGILLVQEHEQQSSHLTHALTVAHFLGSEVRGKGWLLTCDLLCVHADALTTKLHITQEAGQSHRVVDRVGRQDLEQGLLPGETRGEERERGRVIS